MFKQITIALLALFFCAVSYAQQDSLPVKLPVEPDPPKIYRPSGCDTLLTIPTDSFHCTCNCVTFNPKWITDTNPKSIGLNVQNLAKSFDIQLPPEIFQSGGLIGLDTDGPLFSAMFSMTTKDKIVTTRFTWRYMCRSGAFFFEGVTRKFYNK